MACGYVLLELYFLNQEIHVLFPLLLFQTLDILRFLFLQFTQLYNRNTKCLSCVTFMFLCNYMQSQKFSLSLMYTEDVSEELMCSTHLSQCHFQRNCKY